MRNLCQNPYLAYRNDGWYINGVQAEIVTLWGFERASGIRVTGAGSLSRFSECPKIAVSAGTQYTGSVSVRPTFTGTVRTYLDFWNETGGFLSDSGANVQNVSNGVVTRVHSTATVPSGVTHASLSVYMDFPTAADQLDVTMHRLDIGSDPAYFDGNLPSWQWLGPPGESIAQYAPVRWWTGSAWVDTQRKMFDGVAWPGSAYPGVEVFPSNDRYPGSS